MDRATAETQYHQDALVETTTLAATGEADTVALDYAAADAGARFIIERIVRPIIESVDREKPDLAPGIVQAIEEARELL